MNCLYAIIFVCLFFIFVILFWLFFSFVLVGAGFLSVFSYVLGLNDLVEACLCPNLNGESVLRQCRTVTFQQVLQQV